MKFHLETDYKKIIIVISDLHLGAGSVVDGRRNFLEDFHHDIELVDFLNYYSSAFFNKVEVELVINGDFFDLLAVPFVKFFDDDYWSEEASLEKLKVTVEAHWPVFEALKIFLRVPRHQIVYVIGNHDAELLHPSLQNYLLHLLPAELRGKLKFWTTVHEPYVPFEGIHIKHGHEYELAHYFDQEENIILDSDNRRYFLPPWGSYYVTKVLNRFKEERSYINAVRPVKQFVINGIIYDPLFTLRFVFASLYYFIMVRLIFLFKSHRNIKAVWKFVKSEMSLFRDYEASVRSYFESNEEAKIFLVGHTHDAPELTAYASGQIYINTGTWTSMYYLNFSSKRSEKCLSYAHIGLSEENSRLEISSVSLNSWEGASKYPYRKLA